MVFTAPRVGGGTDDTTAWTGGSAIKKLKHPKSVLARRPVDFKAQSLIEEKAKEGLPESRRLSIDEEKSKISLTSWIASIREYCEERGLDTVFRIKIDAAKEVYLLEEWGMAEVDTATEWVTELKDGVLDHSKSDGSRCAICQYDLSNLSWSGKALLNSIDLDLWSEIEKELSYDASGPEVFSAIISRMQQTNSSSVRKLVDELEGLKLTQEPAQNVETFANKVLEKAKRIEGTGLAPRDLGALVVT